MFILKLSGIKTLLNIKNNYIFDFKLCINLILLRLRYEQLNFRIDQLSAKVKNQQESSDQPSYQLIKSIIETYSTLIQVFHQHNEFRDRRSYMTLKTGF